MAALKHADPAIRRKAASALSFAAFRPEGIDARFLDALIEAMQDPESGVRSGVVMILARQEGQRALDALHNGLCDENPHVRMATAMAISMRADPSSVEHLARAAEDEDESVMSSATAALEQISPGHPVARKNLAKLIRMFGRGERDRLQAAMALGAIGTDEAVAVLMEGVQDSNPFDRYFALIGLSQISNIPRLAPIVRCLRDKFEGNRTTAIRILDHCDPPELVEWIVPLLDDEGATVRMAALHVLRKREHPGAEEALQRALNSTDEREREWATAIQDSAEQEDVWAEP
ncbi:MAG: hypothetical protein QOJ65_1776 [Fimbriimonadaceae bacterium]|nr:hypothetical protein [Fimbriimonadaceae bacterium]